MLEAVATLTDHEQLIKEVFIDPIRTVIAVDDEYPTLDSLAEKAIDDSKGWNGSIVDVQRVQELLGFARNKPNPWLVDVYDAKDGVFAKGDNIAPHLQHSDLLVLDYHLDGHTDHGERAIDILRVLASSEHFNLVVVYTKGYTGDFNKVVREIALGLTSADAEFALSDEELQVLLDELDGWEAETEGITQKLKDEITIDTYLDMRSRFVGNPAGLLGLEEGKRIITYWNDRPNKDHLKSTAQLAKWLLNEKQKSLAEQFSPDNFGKVQIGRSEEVNWIRTEKLFVTVLSKESYSPIQFEARLLAAIKASNPSPHRLLLTKMRAEIEQRGLTAEAAILGNRHIQAVWLNEFLSQTPADLKAVVVNTVHRHWEALGDKLHGSLDGFAGRLHQVFSPDAKSVFNSCGLKASDANSDESLSYYNFYSSTKPIDRSHLTTGHVIQINLADNEYEYWVCLSPACDMVPGQKEYLRLKDSLPFVAVKLHSVDLGKALKNATRNVFLFLELTDNIKSFSILKDGSLLESPDWEQMYAWNGGRFEAENKLRFSSIVEEEDELKEKRFEATVVAQLRSEYALNLLQRMGTFLSRTGLGINFKSRQAA